MMQIMLVWILITGSEGGHVPPAQLGPFADQASCERTSALKLLRRYDRQCVQVQLVFPIKEIK